MRGTSSTLAAPVKGKGPFVDRCAQHLINSCSTLPYRGFGRGRGPGTGVAAPNQLLLYPFVGTSFLVSPAPYQLLEYPGLKQVCARACACACVGSGLLSVVCLSVFVVVCFVSSFRFVAVSSSSSFVSSLSLCLRLRLCRLLLLLLLACGARGSKGRARCG